MRQQDVPLTLDREPETPSFIASHIKLPRRATVRYSHASVIDRTPRTTRRGRWALVAAMVALFVGLAVYLALMPPPVAIWCIGDSITDGYMGSGPLTLGGWRTDLNKTLAREGAHVEWVGSVTDNSGIAHDGHCGWTLDQLTSLVATTPLKRTPNVVIVSGGTNDIAYGVTANQASWRLWSLLWAVHERAPDAKVLVWSILPSQTGHTQFDVVARQYNALMPTVVSSVSKRTGQQVFFVDVSRNAKLVASDYSDDKHPNSLGYLKMASVLASSSNALTNSH